MLALQMEQNAPTPDRGHAIALEEALKSERNLLENLVDVLQQQRSGVAGDDLAVVDDSVFAAQRVLLTLAEARRRRQALLQLISGEDELGLGELESVLGAAWTPELASARDALQEGAKRLAQELERNRRILSGAISSGDRLIRALRGAPTTPAVYGVDADSASAAGALLIDRQV